MTLDYNLSTFQVEQVLGKGGFGTVYAGIRLRDNHAVAIKHVAKAKIGALNC